ncbi:MAG: cation:proton antiporter [Pseudomonadota bacterium]
MTDFLLLAFIFLLAGVASVPIAARLGLGSVLGYLIAGIVISPVLSALGVDVVSIQQFAEFGVVIMLFLVGLELNPKDLWSMRTRLLGLGGGQVVLTTGALTGAAMLLGQPWTMALAIGLILSLSSTAIALQTLQEKGLLAGDGGRASFAVLLFEDIAVIPMLALIPLLALPELMSSGDAGAGSQDAGMSLVDGLNGWQTGLVNLGAVGFVIILGSYLTRPIFRYIALANLRELFVATALLMVVGIALLMSAVGLSPALGTFLAGVVLANSEYRHELSGDIDPFRGLLLGLFFMTVGAAINFGLLFDTFFPILALTIGVILLKAATLYVIGWSGGMKGSDRWLMTLGLAQTGEFGFVLLSFSVANAVLPQALADKLLLVIALSMLAAPALFIIFDRVIAPRFVTNDDRDADRIEETSHIIIAGRGRVGGMVDRMLSVAGYKTTVIDYSSQQLENLRKFGVQAYFGDATRPDLLNAAGIKDAKLFVVAIDGKEQITELVRYVTNTYPHVHVMARAVNRHHVYELWAVGCRDIIRETYDSSIRMGRSAFEALGIPHETAQAMADHFDMRDRQSMLAVADSYDVNIPAVENEAYMTRVRQVLGPINDQVSAEMDSIRDGTAPDEFPALRVEGPDKGDGR